MDASFFDSLAMTLFSAVVCIGFPRVLNIIGSNTFLKSFRLGSAALKSAKSDSSQPTAYPELTTVNN
jgi:hypothetical protein